MAAISPKTPRFILASGSPRRRELTAALGWEPIVLPSSVEEIPGEDESPLDYTERLAREKAQAVIAANGDRDDLPEWVLSADTIVVQGGEVLEKPADREEIEELFILVMDVKKENVEVVIAPTDPRKRDLDPSGGPPWLAGLYERITDHFGRYRAAPL